MTKVRLIWNNLWRQGQLLTNWKTSEHPGYPATETQVDSPQQPWKSRHGEGSGNGWFYVTAPTLSGSELVTNGGFTTDASGWTPLNNALLSSVGGGQAGNCLEIKENGTAYPGAYQNISGLTINNIYQFSFYIKKGTGANFKAFILCNSVSYGAIIERPAPAGWTQYKIVFKAGATTAVITLYAMVAAASGLTQLFDTVSLQAVTNTPDNLINIVHSDTYQYWAYIPGGSYNGNTLAAAIKTALDSVTGGTYTGAYSETDAKFTISQASNFTLKWNTGLSKEFDASSILGYDDAADDTGAATYTSDYRRIHYPYECPGLLDCGTAQEINFIALLGHNIPSGATITLFGTDDTGYGGAVSRSITYHGGDIYQFVTALTKRYYRILIYAPDSAASYIQVGTIIIGKAWEPSRSFSKQWEWGPQDASEVTLSDAQVIIAQKKPAPYVGNFTFEGIDDSSRAQALALISDAGCGLTYGFVLCMDYNTPNGNSWFVINEEIVRPVYMHVNNWNWGLILREVL